jgi:hypothetical protein
MMFKRLRIIVLLYVLAFVATAQFLDARRSTDWAAPLWVDIYTLDGDAQPGTRKYLDGVTADEFEPISRFLASEAHRYGIALEQPFRLRIVGAYAEPLPAPPDGAGVLDAVIYSLRMRWLAARLRWRAPRPTADIVAFAVFHEPVDELALDRSLALSKGRIAVANLFASPSARGTNAMVLAHELLHTLGATDKYAPATNAPVYPDGYAAPEARPLLPQAKAELMAGRIPVDQQHAEIPESLRQVVIGLATSQEIGWTRR